MEEFHSWAKCIRAAIPAAAEFVPTGKSGLCSSCLTVGRHSSSFGHGWLRVGLPGHRRDHCRLLPQGAALGVLCQHMESGSQHKCQVRYQDLSFHCLVIFFTFLDSHLNTFPFKILSGFCFHKTSFPPSVTSRRNALYLSWLA